MKYKTIRHQFVDKIPASLDEGKIYISMPFATAVHKCFCGCGNEVVTPLSPTDWKLIFDGETISLDPSIGNWGFPCMSHYWIRNNEVEPARRWSREEISKVREFEKSQKEQYFKVNNKSNKKGFLYKISEWLQ